MKTNQKRGRGRVGSGNANKTHLKIVKDGESGQKVDSPARRALAFRRFWIFLLASALVLIGLVSAVGARLF